MKTTLALFALALIMAGCQVPGDPAPPVAVRSVAAGEVEILFLPCPGQLVKSVKVTDPVDPVIEGPKDKVLWQIRSDEGVHLDRFTAGETPTGFKETVPLPASLSTSKDLAVSVQSAFRGGNYDAYIGFKIQDFPKTGVYGHSGPMSMAEFEKLRKCS